MVVVTVLAADDRFQAFTNEHFLLLGIFLAGCVAVALWGRSHRGARTELGARRGFAVGVAVVAGAMQA